jgi:hypothetical protein
MYRNIPGQMFPVHMYTAWLLTYLVRQTVRANIANSGQLLVHRNTPVPGRSIDIIGITLAMTLEANKTPKLSSWTLRQIFQVMPTELCKFHEPRFVRSP